MALIKCPECGNQVSDQAESCPNCGIRIKPQTYSMNDTYAQSNNHSDKDINKLLTKKNIIIGSTILAVIIMVIVIVAVNVNKNDASNKSKTNNEGIENSKLNGNTNDNVVVDKDTEISLNQTITCDKAEFTITGYDITSTVMPPNPPSYYHYYDADNGNCYVNVKMSIKNLRTAAVGQDSVIESVKIYYDNDYEYDAQFVTVASDGDLEGYTSLYSINALETKTYYMLAQLPSEVENSEKSLTVKVNVDGKTYKCTLR